MVTTPLKSVWVWLRWLSLYDYRYDPMGARTKVIDQRNVLTDYRYDERGRLWQVQPDVYFNNVRVPNTEYSYDEVGNKLTQTDANGHATTWTYDYFGRVWLSFTSVRLPTLS